MTDPSQSSSPLSTRCPQCGTVFKLAPEQLTVAQGWVRCGQCQHAFVAQAIPVLQPGAAAQDSREAVGRSQDEDADDDSRYAIAPSAAPVMPDWLSKLSLDLNEPPPTQGGGQSGPGERRQSGAAAAGVVSAGGADDPAVYGGEVDIPEFLMQPLGQQPTPDVLQPRPASVPAPVQERSALAMTMAADDNPIPVLKSHAAALQPEAVPLHSEAPAVARLQAVEQPAPEPRRRSRGLWLVLLVAAALLITYAVSRQQSSALKGADTPAAAVPAVPAMPTQAPEPGLDAQTASPLHPATTAPGVQVDKSEAGASSASEAAASTQPSSAQGETQGVRTTP